MSMEIHVECVVHGNSCALQMMALQPILSVGAISSASWWGAAGNSSTPSSASAKTQEGRKSQVLTVFRSRARTNMLAVCTVTTQTSRYFANQQAHFEWKFTCSQRPISHVAHLNLFVCTVTTTTILEPCIRLYTLFHDCEVHRKCVFRQCVPSWILGVTVHILLLQSCTGCGHGSSQTQQHSEFLGSICASA